MRLRSANMYESEGGYPMKTSGATDPVWIHKDPYTDRPTFSKLEKDLNVDVCIIGAGIVGISCAYELVSRGSKVAMIEAREVLSGESGRTSGHLSNSLDASYLDIESKHGANGAKIAAASHTWAIKRVGEIAKELGIECEYRMIPGYEISQYKEGTGEYGQEMKDLRDDMDKAKGLGIPAEYLPKHTIKGWNGAPDQRDVVVFREQATFHPTLYLNGVLKWLTTKPNFECYTYTRMVTVEEKGLLTTKEVQVKTLDGKTITCKDAIEATCIPLQKLSLVTQVEYFRTYCVAIRVPKGSVEDCLINDQADPYRYIRLTECDASDDYLVIGGGDHKVGQEQEDNCFAELESWVRSRFTKAGTVDYKWSGQVMNSSDLVSFIGLNQGQTHVYIVTGDTGHGLTHGLIAGKVIADEIHGKPSPWSALYSPKRLPALAVIPSMVAHGIQINTQYKRFLQSDITDIEDLAPGSGGVLNPALSTPIAVYKDEKGNVSKFSALCPHLKGVVCWNKTEKSFDCPVHGSRFSKEGVCLIGPSKAGLEPADNAGEKTQKKKIDV